jgi:hypothetical protein
MNDELLQPGVRLGFRVAPKVTGDHLEVERDMRVLVGGLRVTGGDVFFLIPSQRDPPVREP